MTGRIARLLDHLRIVLRYRILSSRSDPRAMYEFVNLLTRFDISRRPSPFQEVDAGEVLPPATRSAGITLLVPRPAFFSIDVEELWCLCLLARSLTPRRIMEFGTFDGFTTLHLAANTPPDCEILTIDRVSGRFDFRGLRGFPHEITVGGLFHGHPLAPRIRQLTGDTLTFDATPYAGTCDLVFLDADHGYEATAADTGTALRLLRPGGVVVWHDCFSPGVRRFLLELSRDHPVTRIRSTSLAFLRSA